MMIVKYRKYWYGGDFSVKEEKLPDDIRIYNVDMWHSGAKVKDKDIYTEGYVFKSAEKFEDSILIGDAWHRFEEEIYIEDFPVEPIENCTAPKECFIVFEQNKMDHPIVKNPFQFINEKGDLVDVDWDAVRESYREIAGIGKVRRFTKRGIEVSLISMKAMNSSDLTQVEIHTFSYGNSYGRSIMMPDRYFFTTEEKYKNLFNEKLEEYYKLFKE